jgi:hypothetical protein
MHEGTFYHFKFCVFLFLYYPIYGSTFAYYVLEFRSQTSDTTCLYVEVTTFFFTLHIVKSTSFEMYS